MKIKVTSLYVDDQDKALRFYTDVLGLAKKTDFSQGPYRWLTVASPEEPDGTELQLALNNNPPAKAYQQAIFQQGQPAIMFYTDDVKGDYERIKARGAEFTMPPTDATGSTIAMLKDTCGDLIQLSASWHTIHAKESEDDRSRAVHTGSGRRAWPLAWGFFANWLGSRLCVARRSNGG
jgi:predicted enzyme related to lactoylglutathione lyase